MTPWRPRTPSPSWWPRSARSRGWCPARRMWSRRCARWITPGPVSRPSTGDDPAAKQDLVSALVSDALAVLGELAGPDAPQRGEPEAGALGLLALVAGQDVEPAEDSGGTDGRWRIARKVAPDRVISTVDREARHIRKSRSKRRDGFRGHVAAEPDIERQHARCRKLEVEAGAGRSVAEPVTQAGVTRDNTCLAGRARISASPLPRREARKEYMSAARRSRRRLRAAWRNHALPAPATAAWLR